MKQLFLLLFLAACASTAAAQDENIDTFQYRQNGVDILFQGVMVKSNDELRQIELFDAMYPVTIVPRPVLQKAIGIGNRQSILADSLTQAVLRLQYQDQLNALEIEKKDKIIEYQKQFIAFSDSTNQMLNRSIGALNLQLSECRKVATEANKRQTGGKFWSVLIGGGLGFGLGAVLGILVAK